MNPPYHGINQESSSFEEPMYQLHLRPHEPSLDSIHDPHFQGPLTDSNFYILSFHSKNKILLFIHVYDMVEQLQVWSGCIKQSLATCPILTKLGFLIVCIIAMTHLFRKAKENEVGCETFFLPQKFIWRPTFLKSSIPGCILDRYSMAQFPSPSDMFIS